MDVVMKKLPSGRERPQDKEFNESRHIVRVVPKNEMIRKYIKHPLTNVGFLAEGSAEWPNDAFTKRRIRDGDVTIEKPVPAQQPAGRPQATLPPRPAPAEEPKS